MRPQPGPVAVLASILCFWCHIAAAELPSTFYIYSESQQDTQSDTGAAVENYYSFYKGLVACADNPVALFLDNQDVNEVAASSARCDGCTQPLVPDSDDPITQFEWLDKSDAAEWGHYTYYNDRDNTFVDVQDVPKGTCRQDHSDTYNCEDAIIVNRRGALQLVCTWGVPDTTTPAPAPTPEPTLFKAMVVGDSISHGQEGDYTWRYRLYDWATTQNLEMYYVGPYRGTFPKQQAEPPTPAPRQGQSSPDPVLDFTQGRDYASDIGTGWDTGHFAAWGRQLAQDKGQIRQMVAEYQPDILLVELGFNDMGWWVSDAGGTLSSMDTFVSEARAAKSDVKFAIANVPDRTFIDGRADLVVNTYTYNQNLPGWADGWNQDSSPVVVVDFNGAYSCTSLGGCDAAYDGLHPNAKGEFEIASAFSKGMISLGYGKDALSVPDNIPQRPTSTPEGFDAQSLPFGIQVSWDEVYGAHGYDVRERWTGTSDWTVSSTSNSAYFKNWVHDANSLDYQVRTNNGNGLVSDWTNVLTVIAHPQTIDGPTEIHTAGTANGISVTWNSVGSAQLYQVIWWDMDCDGCFIGGWTTTGNSMTLSSELTLGHIHGIWVEVWNRAGGGVPASARRAIAGQPATPGIPHLLSVTVVDGTTALVQWSSVANAAGYFVYTRNTLDGSAANTNSQADGTSQSIYFMYPGVWYYEFCVTAFNGDAESPKSTCIVPSKPAGF